MKHHYVPESYLKNFCYEGSSLYYSKFIDFQREWAFPRTTNISGICYETDFYQLDDVTAFMNNVKNDYTEKQGFWYEQENYFLKLLNAINSGETIEYLIDRLPEVYVSMVTRGPQFRAQLNPDFLKPILEECIVSLRSDLIRKVNPSSEEELKQIEDTVATIREKQESRQSQQAMFALGVFHQHFGTPGYHTTTVNKLKGYKIAVYKIADDAEYFLTSDAPGFSFDECGRLNRAKFYDDIAHFIPLSSKILIGLLHPAFHFRYPRVSLHQLASSEVQSFNRYTFQTKSKLVICESDKYLKAFLSNSPNGE